MSDKQGYTSTVTADQIISSVQADLGLLDNNFYSILLEKWIYEGVRHLCSNQLFIKTATSLEVTNNRASLPPDFRRLIALRYNGEVELTRGDGTIETVNRCFPLTYVDLPFIEQCGCDNDVLGFGGRNYLASYQIVGNEIIFRQNVVDGSEVQLSYLGFNIDSNCMLQILSDWERALSAYTRYKFHQCYPEVKGKFAPMLMQEAKNEWLAQKRWCKSLATTQEFINNRYQIIALARAWFVRTDYAAGTQF